MATQGNQTGTDTSGQPIYTYTAPNTDAQTPQQMAGQIPAGTSTVPAPPATPQASPTAPAPAPTVSVNVNQANPAPTDTPATSPSYTVKSGDTLGGIAKAQGTTLADILASNPQYQKNPDLIQPGQQVNLAKKYQDFHSSMGDTPAPDTNPRQQIQDGTQPDASTPDPQSQFQEAVANFNPVEKMLYDQISAATNTQNTQQTFVDQWKAMENEPALAGMKVDLMNINNVMKGTEDDIRDEITKAGGIGTESQIQAMTAARNKTLLKQANSLSGAIQQKEDYITQIMNLTQADRAEADKQITQKLGLTQQLSDMVDSQTNAAKSNYQKIVDAVGYDGLAKSFAGNTQGMARAEKLLDLPSGSLSNPKALAGLAAKKDLQFVSATATQPAGFFDKSTGVFTPTGSGGSSGAASFGVTNGVYTPGANQVVDSWAERIQSGAAKITDIPAAQGALRNAVTVALTSQGNQLSGKPTTTELGLAAKTTAQDLLDKFNSRLGTGAVGKTALFNFATVPGSDKSNFINDFNTLKSQLSLEGVKYLKGQGAVSDSERALLASAVTKLNLSQSEDEFKTTLTGIINKLNGNAPAAATGTLPNGTAVTKNADGSITDAKGNKYDADGNKIK